MLGIGCVFDGVGRVPGGVGAGRRYRLPVQDRCKCGLTVSRRQALTYAAVVPAVVVLGSVTVAPRVFADNGIAGKVVFLDPGHNGANDASIGRQVPNGRGGTKECQTTGTATDAGYPEHTFNWEVVLLVREALGRVGVRTALSRGNDDALGPCVDERAAMANALTPDAIVSVHADGGPPSGLGFHVNYSDPPVSDAQAGPSVQFAKVMRDRLVASGLQTSTYRGSGGLYGRSDLAGLNLARYPSILLELGNMKNAAEAARMASAEGRVSYANAVAQGIVDYLGQAPARG